MITLFTKYYPSDQFEKNMMGGAEESRGAYRLWCGNLRRRDHLEQPRRKWEDNVKMDLREVGPRAMVWIDPAQGKERWRALVIECGKFLD